MHSDFSKGYDQARFYAQNYGIEKLKTLVSSWTREKVNMDYYRGFNEYLLDRGIKIEF